jgi:site-specific recombinase XerD
LTPLEIQAVCAAFDGKYTIRNRTLFLLCANIGTRITEALNLSVGDVVQNGEIVDVLYLRREMVKGKHEGVALTLPDGARESLWCFIAWKKEEKELLRKHAPLFVSRQGGRLTRQRAHDIFKEVYHKVGLKGQVTTHSPRKTYAKMVYQNSNNDLMVTQRALRHTNIQTTLAYLDTLSDEVTAAMPNFSFDIDKKEKMSNSKIIYLSQVARARGKRDIEKRTEDGSKRSS